MSDELYTDDDRLDVRLRAGLAALVAEAPEPPPLPAPGAPRSTDRRLLALAAVLVLVAAVAVGIAATRDERDTDTVDTGPRASLVGRTWHLVSASTPDGPRTEPPTGIDLTFRVGCDGGRCEAVVHTGCNRASGEVAVTPRDIEAVTLEMTDSACPPITEDPDQQARLDVLATIEQRVQAILAAGPMAYVVDGDELVLRAAGIQLRYLARGDRTDAGDGLVDSGWLFEQAELARGGTFGALGTAADELRLTFDLCTDADCTAPYMMRGHDGCNAFAADVEISDDRLTISQFESTSAGCSDQLSAAVRSVVAVPVVTYRVEGDQLWVFGDGTVLRYRRTGPGLPPLQGTELDAAERGGVEYRLSWERIGDRITLKLAHASPDTTMQASFGFDVSRPDTELESSDAVDIGVGWYAWGVAPAGTERLVALIGGQEIQTETFPLGGTDLQAFGGLLDQQPDTVVAFDAAGRELARKRLA